MTAPYRKKLIEVGLPLVAINAESAREKSIRHGHPSTLHLWWARRPLAACRAVLFASLVDDPDSGPQYLGADGKVNEEAAGIKRADLFNLIEELVMWENSNNADVIRTARAEIARCVASRLIETGALKKDAAVGPNTTVKDLVKRGHCRPIPLGLDKKVGRVRFSFDVSKLPQAEIVNAFLAEYAPPVLDPFCGGGSIPLEAQRLGLRAYASDLNPVPVLITKALIEIPPKFAGRPPMNPDWQKKSKEEKAATVWHRAQGLAADVRYYGQWMRDEAEKRIGHLYPKVKITEEMAKDRPDLKQYLGEELTVIAWLWARTVASPNPAAQGAHVPLMRSFWLSRKNGSEAYIEPVIDQKVNSLAFAVRIGRPATSGNPNSLKGTVDRNGAFCLFTKTPFSLDFIRTEGKEGRLNKKMLAVVAEGRKHRIYLPTSKEQESTAANIAIPKGVPDTDLPVEALGFRVQNYGMTKHQHLFTVRQLVTLTTFSDLVAEVLQLVERSAASNGMNARQAQEYAASIATYLGEGVGKLATFHNTQSYWRAKEGKSAAGFGQGLRIKP